MICCGESAVFARTRSLGLVVALVSTLCSKLQDARLQVLVHMMLVMHVGMIRWCNRLAGGCMVWYCLYASNAMQSMCSLHVCFLRTVIPFSGRGLVSLAHKGIVSWNVVNAFTMLVHRTDSEIVGTSNANDIIGG